MAEETWRCPCCGSPGDPARFEVRRDWDGKGGFRLVEVRGPPQAPYVVTHQRGLCCERHAERVRQVLTATHASPVTAACVLEVVLQLRCGAEGEGGV